MKRTITGLTCCSAAATCASDHGSCPRSALDLDAHHDWVRQAIPETPISPAAATPNKPSSACRACRRVRRGMLEPGPGVPFARAARQQVFAGRKQQLAPPSLLGALGVTLKPRADEVSWTTAAKLSALIRLTTGRCPLVRSRIFSAMSLGCNESVTGPPFVRYASTSLHRHMSSRRASSGRQQSHLHPRVYGVVGQADVRAERRLVLPCGTQPGCGLKDTGLTPSRISLLMVDGNLSFRSNPAGRNCQPNQNSRRRPGKSRREFRKSRLIRFYGINSDASSM